MITHAARTAVLADEGSKIEVGHHRTFEFIGMTFNWDTILATSISALIVIGLAFYVRTQIGKGTKSVPGGVQLFFEGLTTQMRGQIESAIGMRIAPFVLPLSVTLFTFILISNWLSILPVQWGKDGKATELFAPPASDVNFVYALVLVVFVWYHAAGFKRRGIIGHPVKLAKGHAVGLMPINIIEEIAKPVSLSLRLFGNMFAGGVMVALITLFPPYIMWAPNAIWKTFDLFVGLIQAFIFALLTILYFGQSMELEDEH